MEDVKTITREFNDNGDIDRVIYRIDDDRQAVLVFFHLSRGDYDVEMIAIEDRDGKVVTEFTDGWRALRARPKFARDLVANREASWKAHVRPSRMVKGVESISQKTDSSGGIGKAIYRVDDNGQAVLVFFSGGEGRYEVEMIVIEASDGEIVTNFADGWSALRAQPRFAHDIVTRKRFSWKGHFKIVRGNLRRGDCGRFLKQTS